LTDDFQLDGKRFPLQLFKLFCIPLCFRNRLTKRLFNVPWRCDPQMCSALVDDFKVGSALPRQRR
jgi:hypothetical protein